MAKPLPNTIGMRAIILAGGKGTRLRPYTAAIPKPLVPIGENEVVLDIIIRQLARAGFERITLAVSHFAGLIMAYFGDGSKWGVKIDYSLEEKPLHTIGALTLIKDLPENFLVMNGDTLTNIDYRAFFDEHVRRKNRISVTAKKREVKIDFGVLTFDKNHHLVAFDEKPTHHSHVAIGVNCLHRSVIDELPKDTHYGFDDLMEDTLRNNQKIWIHDFNGFWLDIGRPEDYQYVVENYDEIKKLL